MRFAGESADRAPALLDLGLARHPAALDRLAAMAADPGAHPVRRLLVVGDLVKARSLPGEPTPHRTRSPVPWAALLRAGR